MKMFDWLFMRREVEEIPHESPFYIERCGFLEIKNISGSGGSGGKPTSLVYVEWEEECIS